MATQRKVVSKGKGEIQFIVFSVDSILEVFHAEGKGEVNRCLSHHDGNPLPVDFYRHMLSLLAMVATLMKKHLLITLLTVMSSAPWTMVHAQQPSDEPAELRSTRAAYQQQMKAVTDPVKVKYAQVLETLKKTLGARGDVQGALAVQKELESIEYTQRSTIGVRDDAQLIIWNQNNGGKGDRGSRKANIILLSGGKEVWRRNGVRLSWDQYKDEKEVFAVPSAAVDAIRIEIVETVNDRGGLAEIEFIKDGKNVALGCSVTASAYWENDLSHAPNKLTDGDPKKFWLLPDKQKGWAEINLKDVK